MSIDEFEELITFHTRDSIDNFLFTISNDKGRISREDLYQEISNLYNEDPLEVMRLLVVHGYIYLNKETVTYTVVY